MRASEIVGADTATDLHASAGTPAIRPTPQGLKRLLAPRSVAIVGASATPGALGASTIANLERSGFSGDIYLVNPKRDEIGGRRCLKSADELPLGVDVAVLAIPRAGVLEAVHALARRKAGAVIIFSAGFAEGGEAGRNEQREIARIAADSGMVVEGPNCLGIVNYVAGVALTFVETPAVILAGRPGIGIVSQSGAMISVLSVMLTSRNLGISYSISTGNEAASGVEDYLEYLIDDPHTQVIGMLVEQFRDPRRFLALAERLRRGGKRIVLLHPGRSSAARESAATHTGALAGDFDTMRVLVERQGVVLVSTLEELGDVLELALRCPAIPAGPAAVLTESGAFKALALDLCEQIGLPLPEITDQDAPALRAAMPEFVPVSNPVDLTAQALVDPDLYRRTLAALLADERFGSVVLAIVQTDEKTSALKFPSIITAIEELKPRKPVVFAGLDEGAVVPHEYIARLRGLGVPCYVSPERALRAVASLTALSSRDMSRRELEAQSSALASLAGKLRSGVVPEYRAKELLAPFGFAFSPGILTGSLTEAHAAAVSLGFPVVLKAQSADLPHKSDAGGVILSLGDAAQLEHGWHRLHANLAKRRPGLVLEGVLVEKMSRVGTEFIVGGRNDPQWGPVVLVGFGGVQAEVLKDVRLLPADLPLNAIERELSLLKGAALLRAFRGAPPLDVPALAHLIVSVASVLKAAPAIREIDLNPVLVYSEGAGVIALDALITVA